jgi:hypothetical protein
MSNEHEIASLAIKEWKNNRVMRASFDSCAAYHDYLVNPDDVSAARLKKWEAYFAGPADMKVERQLCARDENLKRAAQGNAAIRDGRAHLSGGGRREMLPQLTAEETAEDSNLLIEGRARDTWNKSPLIRAEFRENIESYIAYRRVQTRGLVRF